MSTYGAFSGLYFPVFGLNTEKYRIEETPYRSSHRRCSVKNGVLRNFVKFTEKHLCQSLFFNKVAGLKSAPLLKKRLWHRCFPVNFGKFLRTPFYRPPLGDCFCPYLNNFHSVLFTHTYLYLLHLLIHTYVPLYYYPNLIKLIIYGKYKNYEEIFWIEECF